MVPQVAEPTRPPTVTAVARAAQAMAGREGASLDWTPYTLVDQRAHHNVSKARQTGRQIHPPLRDKKGNLQPHIPSMVHFILEDHSHYWNGTEIQLIHTLAHTHLSYTVTTSNAVVTYGAVQKSTYSLQPNAEGTAYTGHTWAQY